VLWATWRSGYAAACKAVYTGSTPVVASSLRMARKQHNLLAGERDSGGRKWVTLPKLLPKRGHSGRRWTGEQPTSLLRLLPRGARSGSWVQRDRVRLPPGPRRLRGINPFAIQAQIESEKPLRLTDYIPTEAPCLGHGRGMAAVRVSFRTPRILLWTPVPFRRHHRLARRGRCF
jgi:hypothetical protein